MEVDLDPQDVETLLTSLEYSKRNMRDAADVPDDVRRENIARVETVMKKLHDARSRGGGTA